MTADKTYEDGLTEGQIRALEDIASAHKDRLDNHGNRLQILERVMWIMFGIIAFVEILPELRDLIGAAAGSL